MRFWAVEVELVAVDHRAPDEAIRLVADDVAVLQVVGR